MASLGRARKSLCRCLWALALAATFAPGRVPAATTERIVTDWHTGLAISGYDPVAYFTNAAAMTGMPDYEYSSGGVRWRFRNEGNEAAFAADPQVYMPQFGGYDPMGVARGVATAGHPEIWLISGNRLCLFYSEDARSAFTADPDGALEAAEEKWPQVLRTLVP